MIQDQERPIGGETAILADVQYPVSVEGWAAGAATTAAGIAAVIYATNHGPSFDNGEPKGPKKLTNENITTRFAAGIPLVKPQLNLELATVMEIAVFAQSSNRTTLWGWLKLGKRLVRVHIPVTYRFHIGLREPWELTAFDNRVEVVVPIIRANMPPAIHWSRIERVTERRWFRLFTKSHAVNLDHQIVATLNQRASELARLSQVREACRLSAAEYVRVWLHREKRWGPREITAIHVRFADETTFPSEPTLKFTP